MVRHFGWLFLSAALTALPTSQTFAQDAAEPEAKPEAGALKEQDTKVISATLFEMTPLEDISLDPRPLEHPAPELTETPFLSGKLGDLRELRMEQGWMGVSLHWKASNFAHRPLYFEDVLLERHGQNAGLLQPAVSAAHFFGTFPLLPAMMAIEHPWECVYTLGYGRPGNCKPALCRKW